MNRSFDPAMFALVDACLGDNFDPTDGLNFVERCHICGEDNLVREADGCLVDLEGTPHKCPEH